MKTDPRGGEHLAWGGWESGMTRARDGEVGGWNRVSQSADQAL